MFIIFSVMIVSPVHTWVETQTAHFKFVRLTIHQFTVTNLPVKSQNSFLYSTHGLFLWFFLYNSI